jgi:hypothetical protein
MPDAYDVCWPKQYIEAGVTKTTWVKLGRAYPQRQGEGISVMLDVLPIAKDWDGKLMLFPARPRPGQLTGRPAADPFAPGATLPGRLPGDDSDIPF